MFNNKYVRTLLLGSSLAVGPLGFMSEAVAVDEFPEEGVEESLVPVSGAALGFLGGAFSVTGDIGATSTPPEKCDIPSNTQRRGLYLDTNPTLRIGEVTVKKVYDNLEVDYQLLEPGWCLDATQVHDNPTDPNNPGDPATFPYFHSLSTGSDCIRFDHYSIPLGGTEPCISCVAIHADVSDLGLPLDGQAGKYLVFGPKKPSYFKAAFKDEACSDEPNPYLAWCVDLNHNIKRGTEYENCSLYSSLNDWDPKVASLVDKPENLDLVNWVLNHKNDYFIEGDTNNNIQAAIWMLIDTKVITSPHGGISWDQTVVDTIIADANTYGNDFVPGENDIVGLLVECYDETGKLRQITMIEVIFSELVKGNYGAWGREDPYCPTGGGSSGDDDDDDDDGCSCEEEAVTISLDHKKGSSTYAICLHDHDGPTWAYCVKEVSGKDLSHWVLGLGEGCDVIAHLDPANTTYGGKGTDGSTGFYGVKWDTGDSFSEGIFTFTLDKDYPAGTIEALVKAATENNTGNITGPVCPDDAGDDDDD